jgi:hypothetical protein
MFTPNDAFRLGWLEYAPDYGRSWWRNSDQGLNEAYDRGRNFREQGGIIPGAQPNGITYIPWDAMSDCEKKGYIEATKNLK